MPYDDEPLTPENTVPVDEELEDELDEELEEEAEEPLRELVVAKRKGPLKGGMDRPSGGESVGLNW